MHEALTFHALRLDELSCGVRLGCTAAERSVPQEVRVSVELRFARAPKGVESDDLADTVCYAKIAEQIHRVFTAGEYNLIEKMAYDAYRVTREQTGPGVGIGISVHKVKPPVENLRGGTSFRCGDFPL